MISFIISQNNSIPRIKKSIEKLCEMYGKFPDAEDIVKAPNHLKFCGLGYRDVYLEELAKEVVNDSSLLGFLYENKNIEQFKEFKGIGNKVANCINLFGCHDLSCCPIDTWVKKIINNRYNGIKPEWMDGPYAGVYQQYVFCYERLLGCKN